MDDLGYFLKNLEYPEKFSFESYVYTDNHLILQLNQTSEETWSRVLETVAFQIYDIYPTIQNITFETSLLSEDITKKYGQDWYVYQMDGLVGSDQFSIEINNELFYPMQYRDGFANTYEELPILTVDREYSKYLINYSREFTETAYWGVDTYYEGEVVKENFEVPMNIGGNQYFYIDFQSGLDPNVNYHANSAVCWVKSDIKEEGEYVFKVAFAEPNEALDSIFLKTYIDLESLPMLDIDVKDKYIFEDRTLIMETSIDNTIELLAFDMYYAKMSGEFDKISLGENVSFNICIENEEEDFYNGDYMTSYTIHDICVLSEEELIHRSILKELDEYTLKYNLTETALLRVDQSMEHNEKSLSEGSQLGDGRYIRYYLVGKTADAEEYKLYEIYWGEYYSDMDTPSL